jgi:hypothetical protein
MSKLCRKEVERLQHAAAGDNFMFKRKLQPGVIHQLAAYVEDEQVAEACKKATGRKAGSPEWESFLAVCTQHKVEELCHRVLTRMNRLEAAKLAAKAEKRPSFSL